MKSFAKACLIVLTVSSMCGIAQAALISYWALDENTGVTTAYDTSGYNTNHLTPWTYGSGAVSPDAGYTGVIGKAWKFYGGTGTSTYGSGLRNTDVSPNLAGLSAVSYGLWIWEDPNATTASSSNPILMRAKLSGNVPPGPSSDVYTLNIYNPAGATSKPYPIGMMLNGGGGGSDRNLATPAGSYNDKPESYATPGAWTFVFATWQSVDPTPTWGTGNAAIYRNGVLLNSKLNGTYPCGIMRADTDATTLAFYLSGLPNYTQYSATGYLDDAGVWNEWLTPAKVGALYFTPTTLTTDAAAGFYGQLDMQKLFKAYDEKSATPVVINGRPWQYVASGLPGTLNDPSQVGKVGGMYYILLDSNGGGLKEIPEPSTLALLAGGLLGLLCYAWRKRR